MNSNRPQVEIFEMASGDISIWVDGGIHLKVNTMTSDPIELGEGEAMQLGELLIRLANEERG